eukprot:4447540-Prymnesium_polylepis.2
MASSIFQLPGGRYVEDEKVGATESTTTLTESLVPDIGPKRGCLGKCCAATFLGRTVAEYIIFSFSLMNIAVIYVGTTEVAPPYTLP